MSDSDDEIQAIVLDNGSASCKAGFAGDDAPRSLFPAHVGRPRYPECPAVLNHKESYVGESSDRYRGLLSFQYPMEHGIVTDWDDMEKVWRHVFDIELRVNAEDQPVLCTEALMNPHENRHKMTEIMFETFNVPAFYVACPPIMSMYASGRGSGIMLDIGDGVASIYSVYEGYRVPQAQQRIDLAGREITDYFSTILHERGYSFTETGELEIVRDIKEDLTYVALDYEEQLNIASTSSAIEQTYDLPDGRTMHVGDQRFRAPEILFQPSLICVDRPGIHQLLYKSIMKCPIDVRKDICANIILSGGVTMCPGFEQRLEKEIKALLPERLKSRCVTPPERKYSVWIGGSILASLSTFQQMWISREEYDEHGPYISHKKCSP